MGDVEQRSRQAQTILESEIFQEVCAEVEKEAIDAIRKSTSNEEMMAARAKLLVIGDIQKNLAVIQNRYHYEHARSDKRPLA